jgi:lipoic acid synthetase
MNLTHIVITSVTRDDLDDGGAGYFVKTVEAIHREVPGATIETLIPDFQGSNESLKMVLDSGVDILNHNVETVPRLYSAARPEASYQRSLDLLETVKRLSPGVVTKSGLMLGLGEKEEEVLQVFHSLHGVDCDALTIGQYLMPQTGRLPVAEFIHPDRFDEYGRWAREIGIPWVYSGPFVRSSYNAGGLMRKIKESSID